MMKLKNLFLALALPAIGLLAYEPAHAARVIEPAVVGRVTGLPGPEQLTVGGKTYLVRAGALEALHTLHVGDYVELIMDGPADSSSSKVVAINVRK